MNNTPMYRYFVAYSHTRGTGHTELVTAEPLTTYGQVLTARDVITESSGVDGIVITGWQLLSGPDTANAHEALTSLYANLSRACEAANQHLADENADRRVLAETLTNYVRNARTAVGALIGH